jgi:hypothetical protein
MRLLGNGKGKLPREFAQYVLTVEFSAKDKARVHDLLVRNQEDKLSEAEKAEMFAFVRADTMLSILKSKARRTLNIKLKKPAKT